MSHRRLSVEELRQTISRVRKKEFPYQGKEQKKIDFAQYNQAQINEVADVLDTIRDIVDAADQRLQKNTDPKRPGRPSTPVNECSSCNRILAFPTELQKVS